MSQPKEPHFFCQDFHRESDEFHGAAKYYKIREYSKYFSIWDHRNGERIVGESSTAYLASRVCADAIYEFNPQAKIIILLRDPADLLISQHAQLKWLGVEDIADCEKALAAEAARRAGNLPKEIIYPSSLYYSNRVRFKEQIERYKSRFPSEQIKIIISEEMKHDTERAYRQVLEFLGVDLGFVPDFSPVNSRIQVRSLYLHRILKKVSRTQLVSLANKHLPVRKVLSNLNRRNTAGRCDPDGLSALRRRLQERYIRDVRELGEYLDRDLIRIWKYTSIVE